MKVPIGLSGPVPISFRVQPSRCSGSLLLEAVVPCAAFGLCWEPSTVP